MSDASLTEEQEFQIFGTIPTSMRWHPIETAPNQISVLVYGTWAGEINGPDKQPNIWMAELDNGQWVIHGGDYYSSYVLNPTHWMPLPEPPK